jgi:hypothetical protein
MPMTFSPVGMALFGGGQNLGSDLQDQVIDQTEELRKKKMLEAQQNALLGVSGSSAAGQSLFGGIGGFNGTGLLR